MTTPTPYFQADGVTLYCGDCLEILPHLGKVDAVVTDPPYGIARVWKGGASSGWGKARKDTAKRNEWDDKPPTPAIFEAILGFGVPTAIWGGNYFTLPVSRGWLVWNKPERNFTLAECELAWTNRDMVARVCDYRRSDPGRVHPTQKPVGVMEWTVEKLKAKDGAIVLDPFMGSGTTGVACIRTGRKFIGIELDPTYCEIAKQRIEKALSERAGSLATTG
jgi:site-specific DNA-methyltransferase (adenine-specific)